jgi:hypothetical protein
MMNSSEIKAKSTDTGIIILFGLVFIKLLIHLGTNAFGGYGIFRDEFYYLACSHRLDLGYVDQPPLSIYILALSLVLFGDSLFALRLLPAIFGSLTVLLTGLIVRKLGGRSFAIIIACLTVIVAPIILAMNNFYSMNCFDIFLWTLAAFILIFIVTGNKPKHWIGLGLVIGLGLLNKIDMSWFAIGLFLGVVLTRQRKYLLTVWPYVTAVIAFIFFLPFIIWNITHDFAHLEFMRTASQLKYSSLTPLDFILGQLLISNPVTIPIWLAGIVYFFSKEGKSFRIPGIIFLTTFLILVINGHSKPEYLSPAYPILFAAGALQFEKISQSKYLQWLKYALPIVLVSGGIITAPLVLPFLPVETYIRYTRAIGMTPESPEAKELAELPQHYADMFGWENMAKTVSEVYSSLSQEEKSKTVIYARNYGQAGAIEYYSRKYELPPVVSPHNNYWIWGWDHVDKNYQTIIVIGGDMDDHLYSCEHVEQVAIIRCRYCMPYENNQPVFICGDLKRTLREIWTTDKHYQ